jgi:hypothetical protein
MGKLKWLLLVPVVGALFTGGWFVGWRKGYTDAGGTLP